MNVPSNASDWPDTLAGRIDRLAQPVEDLANMLAAMAIFLLMMLGTAQIVLRSVFNSPIAGYIDLVELSMAGMAFLGAAYCQRLGAHIRMELFVGRLKGRWLWAFEIFGLTVALIVIGVLMWYSFGHFLRAWQLGDSTIDAELPVWPSKLLVPVAFALWMLRLFIQMVAACRLFRNPSLDVAGIATVQHVSTVAREEIKEAFGSDEVTPAGRDTTE